MVAKIFGTGFRWVWVVFVVLGLDRVSKLLAEQHLEAYNPKAVLPFFNLTLAYNKGAAFSFLNQASGWQVWFFGLLAISISVILMVWLYRTPAKDKWISIGLTLIIGGALGNLWDRISYGHVIDFIELYVSTWHWPVFNVADSAICIGTAMLIWDALFKKAN